ncbi:hypothetical protein CNO13_07970 (plasmid) [Borrelia miyamotoi]|uniref:Uncharacterized protein n=1 Tax=Borrelia miyamotoi TaxID=47466 RepID=A0AAQ3CN73_9SPIR|nr:hypothetical protein [Borrelia miyamotoi]ATQ20472.1 hypothetical protein CNO10_06770 [Borrelia miyamotoi]WAZ71408.1 hypothetical protein O5403_07130 [Borrelia miyamotoi]WDE71958.1 hypothetical protein CNO13_07970 [Borrelia miyamotoi]WDE73426.1 hypothetical protein CNO14_08175 [Borrelia miyamotoi]WDS47802.1 hypothetical protein EZU72_009045 [Borrelia miyamotoi]
MKFLFILFFFSCEFNTQKIPNIDAIKKVANSIINQSPKPSYAPATNSKVQKNLEKNVVDEKKEKLQKDEPNSDNPQLHQPSSDQTQKKESIKKPNEEQLPEEQLPDQNFKSTKNSNKDYNTQSGSLPNKQVSLDKNSNAAKPPSENSISTLATPVVKSIPKPEESQQQKQQQSNPKLKMPINNQESFKEYKIQDTHDASTNGAMMYEVSLGIKDGDITNNSSYYNFNNNWKLFFAKFNNGALFVITNNSYWGTSFRLSSSSNYIKDGPQGIGLDLEQNHLSKFKNAIKNGNEIFEATTYDDMQNDINIKVNKSNGSDYVFLKFEVTNADINSSDSNNEEEEEFDSFNTIKRLLSEKSFAVKKSDFNTFINIIE